VWQAPIKIIDSSRFQTLLGNAAHHPRKRQMTDLTMNPRQNSIQLLTNAMTEGSYTAVHKHLHYSETYVTQRFQATVIGDVL
jgi:hypothetical protein